MGKGWSLGLVVGLIASTFAIPLTAAGEVTHTYPVTLTIAVDRVADKIGGTVASDAPAQFCEMSTVRVREVKPGKDRVVARIYPYLNEWRMKSSPALRGKRVYAEVSAYHLPSRPVECLGARSRTVTAP